MGAQHPPALLVAVSTGQGPCQPGTRPGAPRALRGDKRAAPQPSGGRGWWPPLAAGRWPRECVRRACLGGSLLPLPAAGGAEARGASALEGGEAREDFAEGHSGGLGEGAEEHGQ